MPDVFEHGSTNPVASDTLLAACAQFHAADAALSGLYAQHAPADPPEDAQTALSLEWWSHRDRVAEASVSSMTELAAKADVLRAACALTANADDHIGFVLALAGDVIALARQT